MLQVQIGSQLFIASGLLTLVPVPPVGNLDWRFVNEAVGDSEDWGFVNEAVGTSKDWGTV